MKVSGKYSETRRTILNTNVSYGSSCLSSEPLIFRIAYGKGMGPPLLRQTLLEYGMVEFDERIHLEGGWNLWWKGYRFKDEDFACLSTNQRVNHHPAPRGIQCDIVKKDGLHRAIKHLCATYPKCTRLINYPKTFNLPREESQFISQFNSNKVDNKNESTKEPSSETPTKNGSPQRCSLKSGFTSKTNDQCAIQTTNKTNNIWILKPADQCRGRGIYLFDKLNDLRYFEKSVVQQYISDPFLIGGHKFDIRIYAVVPSNAPFIVYINSEGLVRFATEPYNMTNLDNLFCHLTNTAINVHAPRYSIDKGEIGRGCKWTISQFRQWLHKHEIDDRILWTRINAQIILTLLSQAVNTPKTTNSCEMFGFDILIDSQLRPWILEVNANPSLSRDCTVDEQVKKPLIKSLVQMLCLDSCVQNTRPNVMSKTIYSNSDRNRYQRTQSNLHKAKKCGEAQHEKSILSTTSTSPKVDQWDQKSDENSSSTDNIDEDSSMPFSDSEMNSPRYPLNHQQNDLGDLPSGQVGIARQYLFPQDILDDVHSCPLYGLGSQNLPVKLKILKKDANVCTNHQNSNTSGLKKWLCKNETINMIKNMDRFWIPHSFGTLRLAFPFNRATRIACAYEQNEYPNKKKVVDEVFRLVQDTIKFVTTNNNSNCAYVMDIPNVWTNIS